MGGGSKWKEKIYSESSIVYNLKTGVLLYDQSMIVVLNPYRHIKVITQKMINKIAIKHSRWVE